MALYLYNSFSNKRELFTPINDKQISMYVCGPTVYARPHLGNTRSVVIYDLLFRMLQHLYGNENILYVRNITDVDDKINKRALELGMDINTLTAKTIEEFNCDASYLQCQKPTIEPRATQHIDVMIDIITRLIDQGYAYQAKGSVFFDVSKYSDYGLLSGRKIDELIAGSRISVDKTKRRAEDFVLWKPADESTPQSAIFDSPFGQGRPGWHIECSAMSYKYLGQNFDIHGGGADLMFPHHSNEIAQSCCAFPGSKFAQYWIHNGFLTHDGEKMSKSIGNIVTLEDFQKNNINGNIVRLMLLFTHYRKPMDYNQKLFDDASKTYEYLQTAITRCKVNECGTAADIPNEFIEILSDDLNTPKAISYLHQMAKTLNNCNEALEVEDLAKKLNSSCKLIGIDLTNQQPKCNISDRVIKLLVEQREKARTIGNWKLADEIRDDLLSKSVTLEDLPDGTTKWIKQ